MANYYHLVSKKTQSYPQSSLYRIFKFFTPFFVIAALAPWVLTTAFNYSSAERSNELLLWIEPQNIITTTGKQETFDVFAEFNDDVRLIPGISLEISSTSQTETKPNKLQYQKPFKGRIRLGTFTQKYQRSGEYQLSIPDHLVKTQLLDSLNVITQSSTVIVK